MHRFQPLLAVVCSVLLLASPVGAQAPSPGASNPPRLESGAGPFARLTGPYRQQHVAPIDLSNSNRLESLLRAGKLYLSLQDTIALAQVGAHRIQQAADQAPAQHAVFDRVRVFDSQKRLWICVVASDR